MHFNLFRRILSTNNMGANDFDQFTDSDRRALLGCMRKALLLEKPNEREIAHFLYKYTEELFNFSKGRSGKIGDMSHRFKDKWGEQDL